MFYSRARVENLPPGGRKEGQTIVTEYSDEELLNIIKEQGGDPAELQRQADEAVRAQAPEVREGDLPGDRGLRKSWARQVRRASRYRARRLGLSSLASLADLGAGRCPKLSGIALKTSQAGNEPTVSQKRPRPRRTPARLLCARGRSVPPAWRPPPSLGQSCPPTVLLSVIGRGSYSSKDTPALRLGEL
jgi:hypothetical protein